MLPEGLASGDYHVEIYQSPGAAAANDWTIDYAILGDAALPDGIPNDKDLFSIDFHGVGDGVGHVIVENARVGLVLGGPPPPVGGNETSILVDCLAPPAVSDIATLRGQGKRHRFQLDTLSIAITVKPLPPAPPAFDGAVGRLDFRGHLVLSRISQDQPARLILRCTGEANPQSIRPPALTLPEALESAPVQPSLRTLARESGVTIEKSFAHTITARAPGRGLPLCGSFSPQWPPRSRRPRSRRTIPSTSR